MTVSTNGTDPVVEALDGLAVAVDESAEDTRRLKRNISMLKRSRQRGRGWREILADEDEPSTLTLLGRILLRFGAAGGAFRRALARELRTEGESVTGIARLFGVSHQRTSALLRNGADHLADRDLPDPSGSRANGK